MDKEVDKEENPQSGDENETSPQLEKPKRKVNFIQTEKRKQAWEKARQKRAENIQKKKDAQVEEYLKRKQEEKPRSKPKKEKPPSPPPSDSEGSESAESEDVESSGSSSEEFEVVYRKKNNKAKPKPKRSIRQESEPPQFQIVWT